MNNCERGNELGKEGCTGRRTKEKEEREREKGIRKEGRKDAR